MKKIIGLIVLVMLAGLLTACMGPGQELKQNSQLAITLTDKPANDIKEVWVTITNVEIQKDGEEKQPLHDLSENPLKVDLLALRFDEALLGDSLLPEGTYNRILLTVSKETKDNTVVTNDGVSHELKVPAKNTLHINHTFSIEPGVITQLVLDADVRDFIGLRGNANNNNGYIINPNAIRVIDKRISSNITGRVLGPDGNPITSTNVNVEIYNQDNVLVTGTLALNADTTDANNNTILAGSFMLKGLLAGDYHIVVTAEGYDEYTSDTITVEADKDLEVSDITLTAVVQ